MTHLYLIRHGSYLEDDENPILNPALSADGIIQVERLRTRLSATSEIKADVLISSPLKRARETADIIAPALGLPVTIDPDMEEWRSEHESVKPDDFMAAFRTTPAEQRPFFVPYLGGETWAQFVFRACNGLNRITEAYNGKNIVIVGHGGIIQSSFIFFFGHTMLRIPTTVMDAGYSSITHWEKISVNGNERWMLERHNDTAHLQPWAKFN